MSYSDTLEHAKSNIKQNSISMQRCLEQYKIMDALKFTSLLLQELRNPKLSPKQYYEIYVLIFDALTLLSNYLIENHPKKHHLADLYELVQYAGNIVPRLYLMITVGVSYLKIADSPTNEILKDMIEMCRGVQNPIRGLFLRYYLSQTTKDFLIKDSSSNPDIIKFNCNFVMINFIEMNKLWVRLQYSGPFREKELRTKERKELQTLIGSQLVRLSQIIDDDSDNNDENRDQNELFYKNDILPKLLEQIVQCKDIICQEYLFDIICQVFPDFYHLHTLDQLLESILHMHAYVSIHKLIVTLVNRLINYINRMRETTKETLKDNGLFDRFWDYINKLNENRPDLQLSDITLMVGSIINLSLCWYPQKFDNLEKLFNFVLIKIKDYNKIEDSEDQQLITELFTFNKCDLEKDNMTFYYKMIINCPSYTNLLLELKDPSWKFRIVEPIIATFIDRKTVYWAIDSKVDLDKFLKFFEPLIKEGARNGNHQEKLSKLCHSILDATSNCKQLKRVENQIEVLLIIKNSFLKGGRNIIFTYPSIITNFWKLIRKAHYLKQKLVAKKNYYDTLIKQLFKYAARCNSDLYELSDNELYDTLFKMNIQNAILADQYSYNEISYEFFTTAFTIFEEFLGGSKLQFQALVYMTQSLQKTRSLYEENYYDSLIVRCTLHGSKLLKKQDQCRAVYLCSHLWWATEISSRGEEEGKTEDFYRHGKRLLECLQRSLRCADSIMDNEQTCELMVEILNRCLYYFIHGDEIDTDISVTYINGLIELIKTNVKSLQLEEIGNLAINDDNNKDTNQKSTSYVIGLDGICLKLEKNNNVATITSQVQSSDVILAPQHHFERTCEYIRQQCEVDDRFTLINI